MGIGVSIVMIALGAILDFAVKVNNPQGVNLNEIGLILLIVGIIGLVVALLVRSRSGGAPVDGPGSDF